MEKYIDAEKLISEIKRYKNKADERLKIKGRTFCEEQKDIALQNLCGNLLHFIDSLKQEQPSLPADIDEAEFEYAQSLNGIPANQEEEKMIYDSFKAGAEWMAEKAKQEQPEADLENNGWIDCRKQMPKETKQWSDTLQGHREWSESDLVLAWDSMYGCRVDATKNGKWMSEQICGYNGQVLHGIIAWRPIPEFNGELLLNAGKEE